MVYPSYGIIEVRVGRPNLLSASLEFGLTGLVLVLRLELLNLGLRGLADHGPKFVGRLFLGSELLRWRLGNWRLLPRALELL